MNVKELDSAIRATLELELDARGAVTKRELVKAVMKSYPSEEERLVRKRVEAYFKRLLRREWPRGRPPRRETPTPCHRTRKLKLVSQ